MRISDWSSDVCSSDLEHEEDALKKRSSALPETQQEVLSLMRDLEVNTQIYTTLLNSTQELQVTKAGTVGNVRIIDYPLVPDTRATPKAVLIGRRQCRERVWTYGKISWVAVLLKTNKIQRIK